MSEIADALRAGAPRRIQTAALAIALLAGVLLTAFAPAPARAESPPGAGPAAPAPGYPNATRQPPQLAATSRYMPYLKAMQDKSARQQWQAVLDDASPLPGDLNDFERAVALSLAGTAAENLRKLDVAEDFMRLAVQANGLENSPHYAILRNIAILQYQQEKHEEALATIEHYLRETGSLEPQGLELHAAVLHALDRREEAAAIYEALLTQQPRNKQWMLNAVAIRQEQGDAAGALRLLRRAWRGGLLTEATEYRNLYIPLATPETLAEAVAVADDGWAKNILARNDATARDYQALAQIAYLDLGDNALATRLYLRADEAATHGEASLNLAKILYNDGNREEARRAAQRALDKGVAKPQDAQTILQPD